MEERHLLSAVLFSYVVYPRVISFIFLICPVILSRMHYSFHVLPPSSTKLVNPCLQHEST